MRKWSRGRGIWVLAVVGLVAAPAMGQRTNLLANSGFDSHTGDPSDPPHDWTMDGVTCETTEAGPWREFVARSPHRLIGCDNRWDYKDGTIEQTVPMTPGTYDLALSFWAQLLDGGGYASSARGEVIVDGEVVAAAGVSQTGSLDEYYMMPDYAEVQATWTGKVETEVTVKFTLVADGRGGPLGWGVAVIDDAYLWAADCTNCTTQHEITSINPNVITTPAGNTTMLISGTNLNNVAGASLWRNEDNRDYVTTAYEIVGTGPTMVGNDLQVDFATAGQPAGLYDLVLTPSDTTNCNPRVVTTAFEILDAATPQNLLVNGSFGVPSAVGNAVMWVGYGKNPSFEPDPKHIDEWDKWDTYSTAKGDDTAPNPKEDYLWQTVPVASGSTVTFDGWMVCRIVELTDSTSAATVTLYDGTGPEPPEAPENIIGTPWAITHETPGTDPGDPPDHTGPWVHLADTGPGVITGVASSGYVTVELWTQLYSDGWQPDHGASARADVFSLTVDPPCASPLNPRFAYPSRVLDNDDPLVTITGGSNLNEVTRVKLAAPARMTEDDPPVEDPQEVVGTIVSSTPVALTVQFPVLSRLPPLPVGLYNIVLEKENCRNPNLEYGRVRRQDWDPKYQPDVPETFANKFEVRSNLLRNGGFDDYGEKGDGVAIPEEENWRKHRASTQDQPAVYNGIIWPRPPKDGPNHGSVDYGPESARLRFVQTVFVRPRREVTLTGWICGKTNLWADYPATHYVRLLDGVDHVNREDDVVMGEFSILSTDEAAWEPVSLTGFPDSGQVTVEWGLESREFYQSATTHVDEFVLTQEPMGCTLWSAADADEDFDVDQDDFGRFQTCLNPAGISELPDTGYTYDCRCFDVTGEAGVVDDQDLAAFNECAAGPGVPIPDDCQM